MIFEARIFVQGVGNYQLQGESNGEADGLVVLFPKQAVATARGLKDSNDKELCEHEARVQAHIRNGATGPRVKFDTSFQDCEIRFNVQYPESRPYPRFRYERTGNGRGIYGLPLLQDFITEARWQGARLPSSPAAEDLTGRLHLDFGALSPHSDYIGSWEVPGSREKQLFSSVMKVELGRVRGLELHLTPLDSNQPGPEGERPSPPTAGGSGQTKISLQPLGDTLDVWVRHYCDMDWPPKPAPDKIEAGKTDLDFVLNYALLPNLKSRLDGLRAEGRTLPVPRVDRSWIRGGPVGGDPSLCQASQGGG